MRVNEMLIEVRREAVIEAGDMWLTPSCAICPTNRGQLAPPEDLPV
jgi:homoaconitase/3-isopropylmalate dehydratase large subunit